VDSSEETGSLFYRQKAFKRGRWVRELNEWLHCGELAPKANFVGLQQSKKKPTHISRFAGTGGTLLAGNASGLE
jgi:hypothetical protein